MSNKQKNTIRYEIMKLKTSCFGDDGVTIDEINKKIEEVKSHHEQGKHKWIRFYISCGLFSFGDGQLIGERELTKKELKNEKDKKKRELKYQELKKEFEPEK